MTDREIPDFDPILREIAPLITALMQAAGKRAERGHEREALEAAMVADILSLARDMINDFQGLHGPDHPAPPASGISLN